MRSILEWHFDSGDIDIYVFIAHLWQIQRCYFLENVALLMHLIRYVPLLDCIIIVREIFVLIPC